MLSIIIVSWNVKKLVLECLESIVKSSDNIKKQIILIDNNSSDGTVEEVKKRFNIKSNQIEFVIIENKRNLGFAKASNQGIRIAKGDYILLLNPDTKVFKDTFLNLIKFAEKNPKCGIIGGKILNPDYTIQPSVRRFPKFLDQALILLKIPHIFRSLKSINNYLCKDFDYNKEAFDIEQVQGSFFLIKREVIDKIGLLDEGFWIWFEEVDYCKRAKDYGFRICYTPSSKIIHYGGQSFYQLLNFKRQKLFSNSLVYYFKKHHNLIKWISIRFLGYVSIMISLGIQIFLKIKKRR